MTIFPEDYEFLKNSDFQVRLTGRSLLTDD
jgi:hypothetical protein